MKVLMISTDRTIFEEGSPIRSRMLEYGNFVEELYILIPTLKSQHFLSFTLARNISVFPTNSSSKLGYVFDLLNIGKSFPEIDVVTTQDPFETGLAGALLAKIYNACLELQIHTDFLSPYFARERFLNRVRVFLAKFLLPKADGIRVVSERIKESLKAANVKLKTEPAVLPMFVDVEHIWNLSPKEDLRKRYPEFSFRFLMVNRLESEKNISLALRAFKTILKQYGTAGLFIAGSGSLEEGLKKQAVRLGIERAVVFLGKQSDVFSLYKTASAFLFTSNYEGYGLALIEAAASDCPIITTDVGVIGSVLEDRTSALVFPVGNEKELVKRMNEMLENPQLSKTLALNAQNALTKNVQEKNKAEYLRKYKKLWESCLSRKIS